MDQEEIALAGLAVCGVLAGLFIFGAWHQPDEICADVHQGESYEHMTAKAPRADDYFVDDDQCRRKGAGFAERIGS